MSEAVARRIFEQAIAERRCDETLNCLFAGGSVTVDLSTGKLVLVSADVLAQIAGPDCEPEPDRSDYAEPIT